jgi:hypothetical protein
MDFFKNDITILSICLSLMFFNCKEKQTVENKNPVTAEGITFTWDADSTYLNITLSAETTGWIALGFDPDFAMKGANFIIGYVKEDSVYIRDDYGNAATSHESDISGGGKDNVANKNGTEVDGITTISFSIPLDSGDNRDRVLELGKSYKILLAHGEDGADNFDSYHKKKTSLNIKL